MTAIGIGFEWHSGHPRGYGWGSALPSGTAQPALPLAEALGRCNPDQRATSPALAKEDVLYATRPKPPAQLIRATRSHGRPAGRGCRTGGDPQALPLSRSAARTQTSAVRPSGRALARPVQRFVRRPARRLDQYLFRERSAVSGKRQASARVFA